MTESARIASLETQVRTLKRMLFGVFGLVVAGAVLGATGLQTVPDVIQAKKFEVVNDEGKVIVELSDVNDQNRGGIITRRSDGGILVAITSNEFDGGAILTVNENGQKSVSISSVVAGLDKGSGSGTVTTHNHMGNKLVSLNTTADGGGSLQTNNSLGEPWVSLHGHKDCGAVTVSSAKESKPFATLKASKHGLGGCLSIRSLDRNTQLTLGTIFDEGQGILLSDEDGNPIFILRDPTYILDE